MERKQALYGMVALKDGKGTISTQSGVLKDTQYSFGTRFETVSGPTLKN